MMNEYEQAVAGAVRFVTCANTDGVLCTLGGCAIEDCAECEDYESDERMV